MSGKCQRRSLTPTVFRNTTTQQVIFSVCGSVNASNNYKKGGVRERQGDTFCCLKHQRLRCTLYLTNLFLYPSPAISARRPLASLVRHLHYFNFSLSLSLFLFSFFKSHIPKAVTLCLKDHLAHSQWGDILYAYPKAFPPFTE